MKALAHSLRIAPKKANLIAKMIRGMSVPDAMESLRLTNKKAARMIETALRSAIANASHNDKQDAQTMIVKTIIVNQGTAYRRGMPKARGQSRPFRKFLSHISIQLGYPGMDAPMKEAKKEEKSVAEKSPKPAKVASQKAKSPVKTQRSPKKTDTASSDSPASPSSSVSA